MEQKQTTWAKKLLLVFFAITLAFGSVVISPAEKAHAETWAQYLARTWDACKAEFAALDKTTGLHQWDGSSSAQPAKGAGTAEDPWQIAYPEELYWVATQTDANHKSMRFVDDIDLSGKPWPGMAITGSAETVIDGQNHTIYNLYMTGAGGSSNAAGVGFITYANNPQFVMKDVMFRYAQIIATANNYNYSVAVSYITEGLLQHVSVEDSLVQGGNFVGALCNGWDNRAHAAVDATGELQESTVGVRIDQCHTARVYTYGGSCIGNFSGPLWGAKVTNSFAVDGATVSTEGHSGGFVSCPGYDYVENSFCNISMYGNKQTSVFSGVNHYNNGFKNCYASGVVEGSSIVGGFVGDAERNNGITAYASKYTNCYSTTMVGMQNTASNMGGFGGIADYDLTILNCYSAGEVGALTTAGNEPSVAGFVGTTGSLNAGACYYDMQTSSMRDHGTGNNSLVSAGESGVTVAGRVTKDMTGADALSNMPGFTEDVWLAKEGVYPQLRVFANPTTFHPDDQDLVKAYSLASVCTAMLYPSNGDYEISDENLIKEMDTVRSIKYLFPFTNNAMVEDDQYDVSWEADDIKSEILEGVPVITLKPETYAVASLAPGVGWTTVKVKYYPDPTDKSRYVVGTRRLRLVPTTTLSVATAAGIDHTAYVAPKGARPLDPAKYQGLMRYDHRDGVKFSMGDVFALAGGALTTEAFPTEEAAGGLSFERVPLPTVGGYVDVFIDKQVDDEWVRLDMTDDLKSLMLYDRDARYDDLGLYRMVYQWRPSGEAGGAFLESVKYLSVTETFSVTYKKNTASLEQPAKKIETQVAPQAEDDDTYYYDPGAYVPGDTVDVRYYPGHASSKTSNPETPGYTFTNWNTLAEGTGDSFDNTSAIKKDMVVYAQWELDKRSVTFDPNGGTLDGSTDAVQDDSYHALDKVTTPATNPVRDGYSFMGWSTDPQGDKATYDPDAQLWDDDVTYYAVWKKNPTPSFSVETERITDPESETIQVGDTIRTTMTAENIGDEDSLWKDVVITGTIPEGVTLDPDSIILRDPDGNETKLDPSEVYDPKTGTIRVPVGDIDGKDKYELIFDTIVNPKALEEPTDDITVKGEGEGTNPDGTEIPAMPGSNKPEGDIIPGDPSPELKIEVTNTTRPDSEDAQIGDTLEYTITASNPPEGTSWDEVVITNVIPGGLTLDPDSLEVRLPDGTVLPLDPDEVYDPKTGTLTIPLGNIPGGKDAVITYKATINESAADEKTPQYHDIGNSLTATGKTPENKEVDETTSNRVWPTGWVKYATPDPTVSKTVSNQTHEEGFYIGDELVYTLTLNNNMPYTHWKNVVVTDVLPQGLTIDSKTITLLKPDGSTETLEGVYDEATRTLSVPLEDVFGGDTYQIIYTCKLSKPDTDEPIVNSVSVVGEGPEGVMDVDVSDSVSIPVPEEDENGMQLPVTGDAGNAGVSGNAQDEGEARDLKALAKLAATGDGVAGVAGGVCALGVTALIALGIVRRRMSA